MGFSSLLKIGIFVAVFKRRCMFHGKLQLFVNVEKNVVRISDQIFVSLLTTGNI